MSKTFWKAALVRAIRTFCQTLVAAAGAAQVIEEVRWKYVISAAALSFILSIGTSVATGLPEVEEE